MHYYQHHIGDFIRDTANLNDHQLATYLRMIWAYYDTEKPITGSYEDIAFAMRSDEKTVRLLLRHYFQEHDDGWRHARCDRVLNEYREKSDKARKSASARWSNANALPTQSERNASAPVFDANQEPITNNQEQKQNTRARRGTAPPGALSVDDLVAEGVDLQHAQDWMRVRKDKGAKTLTKTAWESVKTEARKALMTPAEAVKMASENSWQGFKAEWLKSSRSRGSPQHETPYAKHMRERVEEAAGQFAHVVAAKKPAPWEIAIEQQKRSASERLGGCDLLEIVDEVRAGLPGPIRGDEDGGGEG